MQYFANTENYDCCEMFSTEILEAPIQHVAKMWVLFLLIHNLLSAPRFTLIPQQWYGANEQLA